MLLEGIMLGKITGLYPNYTYQNDRRKQNVAVESDRRSGIDRRQSARLTIDAKLQNDIVNSKNLLAVLSPISPARRISSLPDNIKDGNYTRAAGLLGLAVANFPEDSRDIKAGFNQVFKGIKPGYSYKDYQAPFSFFRGTFLESLTNGNNKFGDKLYNLDKSLFDAKLGEKLRQVLKLQVSDMVPTNRFDINQNPVLAFKLEGKPFARLIGRALLRLPVLSVLALSMLELPAIIKACQNQGSCKENLISGSKQLSKSAVNVISILAGIWCLAI